MIRYPLAFALLCLTLSSSASARRSGIASVGCDGCHSGHDNSTLSLNRSEATPGTSVNLIFTLTDPDAAIGGIYVESDVADQLTAGSKMAIVSNGATHTSPHELNNGETTFEIEWAVPNGQGVVQFVASSLAADNNGRNSGDEGLIEEFDVVYGCSPQIFYRDDDGDGYGTEQTRVSCPGAPPAGYTAQTGDCDDHRAETYPGATEYCNQKDDDCDDEVDEDALPAELYPDADGDGYSTSDEVLSGDVIMGCVPYPGYAVQGGDCDGDNPDANPGAEEVCDGFTDEDCDGRVDERVRPLCGVGWCSRESGTCDPAHCNPGTPIEETCNFMDDDCDGETDEGELCPVGQKCLAGECRDTEEVLEATPGSNKPDGTDDVEKSTASESSSSGCQLVQGDRPANAGWGLWLLGAAALMLFRRQRSRGRI